LYFNVLFWCLFGSAGSDFGFAFDVSPLIALLLAANAPKPVMKIIW